MKLSEVIALIGAGYTKEEINALEQMDSVNKPEVETISDPQPEAPKPEAPKPEAPKPEAPKPEAPKQDNSELLTAINGLTKALQLGNIRNTPQPNEKATNESVAAKADKALMEIYNL